jgi:hypothetical protein
MKQQNFLFVDLVSSIFLLILLIGNFLGLLYITEGNIVISMLGSMFLIVCYFFVIQLLKKNKEEMLKRKYFHRSLLFWVFFIMLGSASFFLMSHFINVEYNCKEQIKSEATEKIKLVDSIAAVYKKRAKDDVDNFGADLKNKLTRFKATNDKIVRNQLTLAPYLIGEQVLNNPSFINVDEIANATVAPFQLRIDNNVKNLDSTIRLNSDKYQSIFDNWKRLSLVAGYAKLNEYVEDNLSMINSKIEELPLDRTLIIPSYNKNQLPLNSPARLSKLYPPEFTLPLIVIVVIHLFILIPFLTKKIRGGYSGSVLKKQSLDPLELENVREI